jgi:hypothetical protein
VCKDPNITDKYVGHTTDPISRKSTHKSNCNNPKLKDYNIWVYQFIRMNGGWTNWELIIIECISCKDGNEARTNERRWVDELKATLNKQTPSRTKPEYQKYYQIENKDRIMEYHKEYLVENKDRLAEYYKEYRVENKDIISEKKKQYYEQNIDKISETQKQYREQNRDEINRKARERYALKKIQNTDQTKIV